MKARSSRTEALKGHETSIVIGLLLFRFCFGLQTIWFTQIISEGVINGMGITRLLVVGLFSKGRRSAFISGTGRTTRRYGREGLGTRREKKPTTDSFVIFEDMPVNPATEMLIDQFKLCARNVSRLTAFLFARALP